MSLSSEHARFEAIYRDSYGAVLRYARRRIDPADAEEVVAEVFTIAWRRLEHIPEPPLPWLLGTARKVAANRHRAGGRAARKLREATYVLPAAARDHADAVAESDLVRTALAGLSDSDREALTLVAWDGLPLADAAQVVGSTAIAFRMRVSRARRRLARSLAELDDVSPSLPAATVETLP